MEPLAHGEDPPFQSGGAAAGPTRPPASGPEPGARGTDGPAHRTAGAPVLPAAASAQLTEAQRWQQEAQRRLREARRRRRPRPEAPVAVGYVVERWQGLLLAVSWRRWRCAG